MGKVIGFSGIGGVLILHVIAKFPNEASAIISGFFAGCIRIVEFVGNLAR